MLKYCLPFVFPRAVVGNSQCVWGVRREKRRGFEWESVCVCVYTCVCTHALESEKWTSWPTSKLKGQKTVGLLCPGDFSSLVFISMHICLWMPVETRTPGKQLFSWYFWPAKQGKTGLFPTLLFSHNVNLSPVTTSELVTWSVSQTYLIPTFWV